MPCVIHFVFHCNYHVVEPQPTKSDMSRSDESMIGKITRPLSSMLPSFPRRISRVPRQSGLLHCLGWHVPVLHTRDRSDTRRKRNRQDASQHQKSLTVRRWCCNVHYCSKTKQRWFQGFRGEREGRNFATAATLVLTSLSTKLSPVCFLGLHRC